MQRNDVEREPKIADETNVGAPQGEMSLAAAAAAAAVDQVADNNSDSDSDFDSDLDSDDSPDSLTFTSCILELKIDVDPATLETIYSLRAVPHVVGGGGYNPFNHLDEAARLIRDSDQAFYNYFAVSGAEAILEKLKAFQQNDCLEIGNEAYAVSCLGVIGGSYGRYNFPAYLREFKDLKDFSSFIRVVDLILSGKIAVDKDELKAEFARQDNEYKLNGDTHICEFKIRGMSNACSAWRRKRDLQSYRDKKQKVSTAGQVSSLSSMAGSAQRMLTWLYDELAHTLAWSQDEVRRQQHAQPAPVLSMEAGVQERLAVIARLRQDQYANIDAQKRDLKRLFQLRAYFEPTEAYYNARFEFARLQGEFWSKIDKPECWQDPAIIAEARKLMIESILVTDSILADMECFLMLAGEEPTADNVAALLANQQLDFCRTFIYSGVIDFYPFYREKSWRELVPNLWSVGADGTHSPIYDSKFADRANTNESFFREGTPENEFRKLYNTLIKDGFKRRYGTEKPDGRNDFCAKLSAADCRFGMWTSRDSKVNRPVKETWGQFFQRKIQGGDAPVVEELTFSHPAGSTRPT